MPNTKLGTQNFSKKKQPNDTNLAPVGNILFRSGQCRYKLHTIVNEGDDDKHEIFYNPRQIGRPRKNPEGIAGGPIIRKRGRPRKSALKQQHSVPYKTPAGALELPFTSNPEKDMESNTTKHRKLSKEHKISGNIDARDRAVEFSNSSDESNEDSLKSTSSADSNGSSCNDSDSGIAEFESESESDDESESSYSKRPIKKNKPFIDKAFTQVSLNNIIRRRDVIAINPDFSKKNSMITRASRCLDYKESSSDDDADTESDKHSTKETNKKQKAPKQRKQTNSTVPERRKYEKKTNSKIKQKKNSESSVHSLPVIDEEYTLSVIANNLVEETQEDEQKNISCCDFEPHRPGQIQSDIVALAGSNHILMLDVQQEKFIKKYVHSEHQEDFQCIAWTTVPVDDDSDMSSDEERETCNILAAAGKLGSIKLLNPLQNECYRYLFGHQGMVVRMVFSELEPRWLFSISVDHTVRLWDIGTPITTKDNSICLAKFKIPPSVKKPSAINVSRDLLTIVVGCSDGNLVHFKLTDELIKKFRTIITKKDESEPVVIDHLAVYPAGNEWHEGCIDDIYVLGQDGDESSPIYNHVSKTECLFLDMLCMLSKFYVKVSRGSNDMEIVVWNSQKSTVNDIEIYKSFDWPESDGASGLRFKVVEKNEQKVMVAGDYEGRIHVFKIDNETSKTLSDNSKEIISPTKILTHEASNSLIRDISMSNDTRFVVAIDADNNTLIWTPEVVN